MHEMGIAVEILRVALASIPEPMRGVPVEVINVQIGKLSGVVPDSLEFCFEAVVLDTPLAGAQLKIEEIPISVRCRDCGGISIIETAHFICQHCQGVKLEVVSGQELQVTSLELAEPEAAAPPS